MILLAIMMAIVLVVVIALIDIWWNFREMTRRRGADLPSARVVSSLRKSKWRAP